MQHGVHNAISKFNKKKQPQPSMHVCVLLQHLSHKPEWRWWQGFASMCTTRRIPTIKNNSIHWLFLTIGTVIALWVFNDRTRFCSSLYLSYAIEVMCFRSFVDLKIKPKGQWIVTIDCKEQLEKNPRRYTNLIIKMKAIPNGGMLNILYIN